MNLASRDALREKRCTPEKVGPNTYIIADECCNYKKKNLTPFLSSSLRMKPLKNFAVTDFYDFGECGRHKIKYGNSMHFTSERKTIVVNKDFGDENRAVRQENVKKIPSKRLGGRGKVAFCRVPYSHEYSAPSIPNKNSTGYDVDFENKLFKNPPRDIDITIGPASYDVPTGEPCFNTIRYRGCAWSKSNAKRDMSITNNNPGPTEYSPKDPKCIRYIGDFQRQPLLRKCCNVPRYTCILSCKSQFQKQPGPGAYEIVDLHKIGNVKNLSLGGKKPFISKAKRFEYRVNDGPGPQQYQVCDCFKRQKDFNITDIPFCNAALRFKHKKSTTPAPDTYDIKNPQYHKFTEKQERPAFLSTAQRKFFELGNLNTPDPANYNPPISIKCCDLQDQNRSSVFSSMVCRFGRYKDKTDLSAASYNITVPFKNMTSKISPMRATQVGFNSTEEKGKQMYDFPAKNTLLGKDTPGVGAYSPALRCSCESTGVYFSTSPRSVPVKIIGPGPGYYEMHPSNVEALWAAKKTYNHRLMSNVRRRNPNMKVPRLGMRTSVKLSRKKILRFFVKTGDFKHCW